MTTFRLLLVPILLIPLSCTRDTRPPDIRIREAITDALRDHGVRGASVALILPDDSLHRRLPPYRYVDSTITIRQLLAHTSGLFMFWENQKVWDDLIAYRDSVFTPEAVLSYLQEPHFAPGEGFRYSNTNYLLLAMIVTRATGSTLSAEMRRRFWDPLRLQNTFLSMEEEIPDRLLHVWGDNFEKGTPIRDITALPRTSHETITYGSSGILATPGDLALWARALFGGRVLRPSSLAAMMDIDDDGYGLGVQRFRRSLAGGERAVGHGGGNIGAMTYMIHAPERRVTLIVSINAFHGKCLNAITEDVADIVMKAPRRER